MKSKNIKEMLFYFSLIFIMVMSLNLAVKDCTGMELSIAVMVAFTLIAATVVSVILIFPISLLAVLLAGIGWLLSNRYEEPARIMLYMKEIQEFFSWLYGYIVGYNYFESDYTLAFAILYTIFVTFVVSLIVYSSRGSFVLIVLGTAAMSFFWFVYVEKARLYLVFFLFASIMLHSCRIYKKRLREWRAADSRIEYNVGHNWMLCSAGVAAVSLMISLALSLNFGPVRWPWLNDKAVSLFPFIAEWRNDSLESFSYGYNSRFSLNSAGYINKKLGGDLRRDASVLMTVKAQGEETIYLRGAVLDKYNDNTWLKSEKGYREYKPGDPMPLPYGEGVGTYEKVIEVTYEKLMSSTVFAPYSVYRVQHSSKRIYADKDSEVYTSRMTMKDQGYKVTSIMPYMDADRLRQAKALKLGANEFRLYTAVAPDIPGRVISLAREITEEQDNNYDKAKAVEEYLRQNYKYTLKPPKLPPEAEFTDHFLFEGKEGYCTYFATSMAVLLRAAGVPCRYVEGFVARYEGDAERQVRGTDAHAWVEVYFDDYGWVAFEPTPRYPAVGFRTAPDAAEELDTAIEPDVAQDSSYVPGMPDRRRAMEEQLGGSTGTGYAEDGESRFNIGKLALLLLASLVFFRFCFMYTRRIMKEIRLSHQNGRQFAMEFIGDVIWYLRLAAIEIKQDETLREFIARAGSKNKEIFSEIPNVTAILERVRYGSRDIDSEERKTLEVFRKEAKGLALKKAGIVQFFISLYILGR